MAKVLVVSLMVFVAILLAGIFLSHLQNSRGSFSFRAGPPQQLKTIVPSGKQVYQIAQAKGVWPKIIQAVINPPDVHVGDTQSLSLVVEDNVKITEVYAEIQTDNGTTTLPLALTGATAQKDILPLRYYVDSNNHLAFFEKNDLALAGGVPEILKKYLGISASAADLTPYTYSGQWTVHDTHSAKYYTTFVVKDAAGRKNSLTMAWLDPCLSGQGSDQILISNCTVSGVTDGIDGGNLQVGDATHNITISISSNSNFVWNAGQSITIYSGSQISISQTSPAGQLRKAYLCGPDADNDGYLVSLAAGNNADCSDLGSTYRRRARTGTSTSQTMYAGIVVNDTATGTIAWNSPTNAQGAADTVYATTTLSVNSVSNYITGYNFGFSVPSSARIDGIVAEFDVSYQGLDNDNDGLYGTATYTGGVGARIVKFFVQQPSPTFAKKTKDFISSFVAKTALALPLYFDGYEPTLPSDPNPPAAPGWSTDTFVAFGTSTYLWNIGWAPSDINASGFAASLAVRALTDAVNVRVDAMRVTVYYTVPDANIVRSNPLFTKGISDCDDTRNDRWQYLTGYLDSDADGYTVSTPTANICSGNTVASPYRALSSPVDCYDSNGLAHPGQTAWFTTNRGDGSFDYDCDGVEDQKWTNITPCSNYNGTGGDGSCVANGANWTGGTLPACGTAANWTNGCSWNISNNICINHTVVSTTQACH